MVVRVLASGNDFACNPNDLTSRIWPSFYSTLLETSPVLRPLNTHVSRSSFHAWHANVDVNNSSFVFALFPVTCQRFLPPHLMEMRRYY